MLRKKIIVIIFSYSMRLMFDVTMYSNASCPLIATVDEIAEAIMFIEIYRKQ